jgi:hypothetical protein
MTVRRARGAILRLVRRRPLAVTVGAALAAPAAWLEFSGRSGAWWLDGLALILLATGAALVWAGITGPKPDWIEGTENSEIRRKK